jgi:hypothetical protein
VSPQRALPAVSGPRLACGVRLAVVALRFACPTSRRRRGTPSGSVTRLTPLPAAALRAPTRAEARCKTGTESLVSKNSMNSKFSMPGSYHQPNQAVLPYCFLAWSLPKQYAGCDLNSMWGTAAASSRARHALQTLCEDSTPPCSNAVPPAIQSRAVLYAPPSGSGCHSDTLTGGRRVRCASASPL